MRRVMLERAGTVLVLLMALAVLVVVGASATMYVAAEDLYASFDEARGVVPQTVRSAQGKWLSSRLTTDLAGDDLVARRERADQLTYRGERLRETASVAALVGLFVGVLTARPARATLRGLEASSPAANTTSNGTV